MTGPATECTILPASVTGGEQEKEERRYGSRRIIALWRIAGRGQDLVMSVGWFAIQPTHGGFCALAVAKAWKDTARAVWADRPELSS